MIDLYRSVSFQMFCHFHPILLKRFIHVLNTLMRETECCVQNDTPVSEKSSSVHSVPEGKEGSLQVLLFKVSFVQK